MEDHASGDASLSTLAPALFAGALGLAPLGLQPVLAQATASPSVSTGLVSGCELAAMALACAIFVTRPLPAVLYGLMMSLGQASALYLPDFAMAERIFAGIGEGGLCALAVAAVLRGANPVRAASLFTALSALPQICGWLVQLHFPGPFSAALCLIVSGALAVAVAARWRLSLARTPVAFPRLAHPPFRVQWTIAFIALLNFSGDLVWVDLGEWLELHKTLLTGTVTSILFACMVGQIVTTLAMARYGPEHRIEGWLTIVCGLEALGVVGLLTMPAHIPFAIAGILATAAWQASLPLATGLYLAIVERTHGQLVLPVSLGAMSLASSLAGDLSPQRIVACLALVIVVLVAGMIGLTAVRLR
ncbi:hypothetical protein WSK_4038 [Novosphingobium sp. Rr 2-17]|uniref:hypothetical protein n=1 Tax=Novosphingobium sp. Rr 2-17 TaxID=555793 RepID=UPI0002699C11|nr:hypothetical protein [Novosphingobium sp. Rr 2-17]EIZ77424.1 hypothetical protein WSK_4038 [Novosphingobium sp. Rr 2-17]